MENVQTNTSAEWYREQGKIMFFHNNGDADDRSQGLRYLIKAHTMNDTEASYIVATLMLQNILRPTVGDPEEHALEILRRLADNGDPSSRELLNRICISKYENAICDHSALPTSVGLVDFNGKPINIDRKGLLTPIDAELKCVNGNNIFQLSANIAFFYGDEIPDIDLFEKAIIDGIMEWQGEYTVFGGQKLSVKIDLTTESRLFDNVIVIPMTSNIGNVAKKVSDAIGTKTKKEQVDDLLQNKRSFAVSGIKWSVRSRKIIYIQSEDNSFTDYAEMKDVAKHEFGHALGLGDLYYSPIDNLSGVEKGTYRELDSYYVSDKLYNLVMCDHHGPISNNDIEMILLAFRDNEAQLYQSSKYKGKISKALGKGN